MKRILFFACMLVALSLLPADDYQDWLDGQSNDWTSYRSSQDSLFVGFLERDWTEFELSTGKTTPMPDLPERIPVVEARKAPELNQAKTMYELPIKVKTADQPTNYEQLAYAPAAACTSFEIDYFGLPLEFCYVDSLTMHLSLPIEEKSIANAWFKLSNTPWEDLSEQLGKHREHLNLNDWGYCRLLHKIGSKLTANDPSETNVFIWFMLLKTGYDARLGFEQDTVYLMVPTDQELLDTRYLMVDDRTYYILDFENTKAQPIKIKTYDGKYPKANNLLNMRSGKKPLVGKIQQNRAIEFSYDDSTYTASIAFNPSFVDYYSSQPEESNLAPIAFSSELEQSLVTAISPILAGKNRAQAVNIILRFTQSAFRQDQATSSSGNSADALIESGIADSRARTRFFIGMIQLLTDYDVVALDYDGYFAAGVLLSDVIPGSKVDYDGSSYVVCDPFYAYANIGTVLPQFEDVEPKIEVLK